MYRKIQYIVVKTLTDSVSAGPKAINPESGTLTRDGMAQINAAANIGVDDLRRMCILR